jgi:hypothetical protein
VKASVTDISHRAVKQLTAEERLECLLMAKMNEEKCDLCREDQPALKAFFMANARLLLKVAGTPT